MTSTLDQLTPGLQSRIQNLIKFTESAYADLPDETKAIVEARQLAYEARHDPSIDVLEQLSETAIKYQGTSPAMAHYIHFAVMEMADAFEPQGNVVPLFPNTTQQRPNPHAAQYILQWNSDSDGMPISVRSDCIKHIRLNMLTLMRRGKEATLYADNRCIGGITCKTSPCGIETYTARISGETFTETDTPFKAK